MRDMAGYIVTKKERFLQSLLMAASQSGNPKCDCVGEEAAGR
jgi:hypothetical protein